MNSQRAGGTGLILDKILMTLFCRDTASPMTPINTSANHPTNDLCSAENTTFGFCCFSQKVSIMKQCHMCRYGLSGALLGWGIMSKNNLQQPFKFQGWPISLTNIKRMFLSSSGTYPSHYIYKIEDSLPHWRNVLAISHQRSNIYYFYSFSITKITHDIFLVKWSLNLWKDLMVLKLWHLK